MRTSTTISFAGLLVLLTACGGADKKQAKSPEEVVPSGESAQADMPPAPSDKATETTASETPKTDDAMQAGGAIKIAPMKLVSAKKGKDAKNVELKADGTILANGKAVAKIAGDQVDALDGSGTLVTVGVDGSLVGQGVKPGMKLSGDEIAWENGGKLSVGDDGTITTTTKDGKSETLGKAEGGEKAKRAAAIVSVLMLAPKSVDAAKPKK